jgi:hypothetical protein
MTRTALLYACLASGLLGAFPGVNVASAQNPSRPPAPAGLDTAAIDRAIGRTGQVMAGEVYRVGFPRTDLTVTVGDVKVQPGLALGSWAAFKATPTGAVVDGDLVLLDAEINPVISALQDHDFQITAVHNHLLNETPKIMYVHYWAQGSAPALAQALREALGRSQTPISSQTAPAGPVADPPVDVIEQAIGLRGMLTDGVLALSQPRPETIQMMGVTLPPSMGMATSISFQSAGPGRVAATGDFVMLGDEVNKVARALRAHDISITALHNHMLNGTPELYFMHFWGEGDAAAVASGLKAALAELKK